MAGKPRNFYQGKSYSEWATELGLPRSVVVYRAQHNLPMVKEKLPSGRIVKKIDGKTYREWAVELGMNYYTVRDRVARTGHPTKGGSKYKSRNVEYNGQMISLRKRAKELGITVQAMYIRLDSGWSIEKAFTTPNQNKR